MIAENDQYRVVEVKWKPGQRDAWHSHPVASTYFVTDCSIRSHTPDGNARDVSPKAGAAFVNPAVSSHSVENRGQADCKVIMFEPK